MLLLAKGLCATCYRNGRSITCRNCGHLAPDRGGGLCCTCHRRASGKSTGRLGRPPEQRIEFLARDTARIAPRCGTLGAHERRALADIARLTART